MTGYEEQAELEVLALATESDVVRIRQVVRYYAKEHGAGIVDQTRLTTAASEILRNMYVYAGGGKARIALVTCQNARGISVVCEDEGPGIADIELAMQDGYSSCKSMGAGLPGARRLVDAFDIRSTWGTGTRVELIKHL